jgi:hypothetical protein
VLLQLIHDAQALQVMLETSMVAHAIVQCLLTGVPEWRVPEVVGQRDRLGQIFIQPKRARYPAGDLSDFQTVRQTGAKMVAFVVYKNLGLVFKPAKSRRVNNPVAIPLKFAAMSGKRLGETPSTRIAR